MKKRILSIAFQCLLLICFAAAVSFAATSNQDTLSAIHPIADAGKWGFADEQGRVVIPPVFDDFAGRMSLVLSGGSPEELFPEGIQAVQLAGRWMFVKLQSPEPIYTSIHTFSEPEALSNLSEGLACVKLNGKYGYVDRTGRLAIAAGYQQAQSFYMGLAAVKKNGQWLIINTDGKTIRPWRLGVSKPPLWLGPFQLRDDKRLNDGMRYFDPRFLLYPENRSTEILRRLEAIVPPGDSSLFPVRIDGKWGYLATRIRLNLPEESLVITPQYEDARSFSEELGAVRIHGKWGYIDENGEWVIRPTYDEAGLFSDGLAAVKSGGKFGYIDHAGNVVIALHYDRAGSFSRKVAVVIDHAILSYIDLKANTRFDSYPVASDFEHPDAFALHALEIGKPNASSEVILGAPSGESR